MHPAKDNLIGSKCKSSMEIYLNTPGTAGGPGDRDRMLSVKSRKNLLVMPKYWGKQITHGSFPEVGQKQKTEKKERKKERKTEQW